MSYSLIPPQKPFLFDATAESIVEDAQHLVENLSKVWDRIAADTTLETATFENAILPLIDEENIRLHKTNVLRFYASTSPKKDLRDASKSAQKIFKDAEIDCYMRDDMFRVVDAVSSKSSTLDLDPESLHFLNKLHRAFLENGAGLPAGPRRDRFKIVQKRLQDCLWQCVANLNADSSGIWLTLKEMSGMPQDVLNRLKKGDGENEGKLWLTFKVPDTTPAVTYIKNSTIRRQVYTGMENRIPANVPLYKEVVVLRHEVATLLGYPSHAAFKAADKMVKTRDVVNDFLHNVRQQITPKGHLELGELRRLKAELSQGTGSADNFYYWDRRYHRKLYRETKRSSDPLKVTEYFPLERVLSGIFDIYSHIFSICFNPISKEQDDELTNDDWNAMVWHKDVQMYAIWNDEEEGGEFLGYLYFDLHPREGKYNHAGHYLLSPGFINLDGTRRYPSGALVLNLPAPLATKPSLLSHDQIRQCFHEIGHGMHNILLKTRYARFHGTSVDRDFVEAPSMMFENFFWQPCHMKELSFHYSRLSPKYMESWKAEQPEAYTEPSEKLDDETITEILNQKESSELDTLFVIHQSAFDMAIHDPPTQDAIEAMDLTETWNKLRNDITGCQGGEALGDGWHWATAHSAFRAPVTGYDAGYYTYLLAKVYSFDIFYKGFKTNTMSREEGRKYRYTLLERGGSQPEMKTLEDYLGRKPSTEAFCKEFGIQLPGMME